MRRSWRSWTVFWGALVALSPAEALATGSPRVQIRVAAPNGCIQPAALARDVDAILERDAIELAPSAALARIDVVVGPDTAPDLFRAVLKLETPDGTLVGTREVVRRGPSCSVLDGPVAIVTALLVDAADDTIRLVLPPPPPTPAGEPAALPTTPGEPWRLRSAVAGTLLLGLLPPAVGARVDMQVIAPRFVPLLVRFDAYPRTTIVGSGPGGDFLALAGSIGVCPTSDGRLVRLDACLGGTAGLVRATGRAVPIVGESTSFFGMAFAEGGASLHLHGPLSARASIQVAMGYHAANWYVVAPGDRQVVVWDPWPATVIGALGLVLETSSMKGGARER